MNLRTKTAMSAASVLIVAAGAAGCGGGSGSASSNASNASDSTSQKDFCSAFETFEKNVANVDPSTKPADIIKTLKTEAAKLGKVGTPSGITSSEKDGYTTTLGAIDKLPDDASLQDLSSVTNGFSATQKKDAQAFQSYLDKECPTLNGSTGSSSSPSAG